MSEAEKSATRDSGDKGQSTARTRKMIAKLAIAIFLLTVILAATGFYQFNKMMRPVAEAPATDRVVFIPPQSSTNEIGTLLEKEGLIRHRLLFSLYTRLNKMDTRLQAGEYQFSPNKSLPDIVTKIVEGQVKTYSFTIPEGYTVEQIAQLLADQGFVDKEKFLYLVKEGNFDYALLEGFPNTKYRLEGFLFPDTYQIPKGFGEKDIINLMLRRFSEVFTDNMRQRAQDLGITVREAVTLASLIEREAKEEFEQPIIASVISNRLQRGMLLQIDATVQYALGEHKQALLYDDLKVDSPYNTYQNAGLPPGPIASPGKSALKAALYPASSDYFYYVAKPDGTHQFTKTLAEHNRAKRKYLH